MDPDVQAAAGSGGRRRGAQVLRLVLRQGGQDGRGTRLHSDAEERRRQRQEDLGERGEGRLRQAALRNGSLSWCALERAGEPVSLLFVSKCDLCGAFDLIFRRFLQLESLVGERPRPYIIINITSSHLGWTLFSDVQFCLNRITRNVSTPRFR